MMDRYFAVLVAIMVAAAGAGIAQEEKTPAEEKEPRDSDVHEEVVISASSTSDDPSDAPAAVDVIDAETLENIPADTVVDQLRRVPGINVVQFSARDINLSSRSSSGQANNTTLALSDGRTLYQDFLGFVMWEFAPTDPDLIDRIEVVRGPASSLWGANAVGGLVHIISKSPHDTTGGTLVTEAASYGTRSVRGHHSFRKGPWAMRVSGGVYKADPFPRPQLITNVFGEAIDPDLGIVEEGALDAGTDQPRLDLRADWRGDGKTWILQGGWARTRGRLATGLGPFDIRPQTAMSYAQARFRQGPTEVQAYFNFMDGDATNLINGIPFGFTSASTNLSVRSRKIFGQSTILGFGAEARRSTYDLSIAPDAEIRTILSGFGEVDFTLSPRWRAVGGVRLDHVRETIGTTISPRAGLIFQANPSTSWRVSWGRAFRAPSVIENDLYVPSVPVAILDWEDIDRENVGFPFFAALAEVVCSMQPDNCGAPPGEIPKYTAVTAARGSLDLREERTDSIEAGFSWRRDGFGVSASIYRTRTTGGIDFPVKATYGNGPDGEPGTADDIILPADPDGDGIAEAPAMDVCPLVNALRPFRELCRVGAVTYPHFLSIMLDGQIPALFAYTNSGITENFGIEIGADWTGRRGLSFFTTYSWQDDARADGIAMPRRIDTMVAEREQGVDLNGDGLVADTAPFVNNPPGHRLSLGGSWAGRYWQVGATVDYVSKAFWQDVLTPDFWGWTDGYTLVGGQVRWQSRSKLFEVKVRVTNLFDERIQQHIFGDVIGRRSSLALRWRWE